MTPKADFRLVKTPPVLSRWNQEALAPRTASNASPRWYARPMALVVRYFRATVIAPSPGDDQAIQDAVVPLAVFPRESLVEINLVPRSLVRHTIRAFWRMLNG